MLLDARADIELAVLDRAQQAQPAAWREHLELGFPVGGADRQTPSAPDAALQIVVAGQTRPENLLPWGWIIDGHSAFVV